MFNAKLKLGLDDLLSSLSPKQQKLYREHLTMMFDFVDGQFDQKALYPYKTEIEFFSNTLSALRQNFEAFIDSISTERLTPAGYDGLILEKQNPINDESDPQQVLHIINWAMPQLNDISAKGYTIEQETSELISLQPIGITPATIQAGFVMIEDSVSSQIHMYSFLKDQIIQPMNAFGDYSFEFHESKNTGSLNKDPITLKQQFKDNYKDIPVPAIFIVIPEKPLPLKETVLPLTGQKLKTYLDDLKV